MDRSESLHGNLDACIKSALPLPLTKECQYLALIPFVPVRKSPLCLWELDILQHSIRKLQTYEEIHIVVTRYVRCDGVYRFLSAGGNDRYGRTY
jgi:hypothetical protein